MKTYKEFILKATSIEEKWIPPAAKKLRGGTKSPLQVARERGTDTNLVASSVKRFAEPINNPYNQNYDYNKSADGKVTVRSKRYPIEVSYTPGNQPNTFIQNSRITGNVPNNQRTTTAREMQTIKKEMSAKSRPGTTFVSQPTSSTRARLNTKSQGMGEPNKTQGVQAGVSRNRSPKQKEKGAKPLDPIEYKGIYLDPNH